MPKSSILRKFTARLTRIHFFKSPKEAVASTREQEPAELIVMLSGSYIATPIGRDAKNIVQAVGDDVVYWPVGAARIEENDPERPSRCICIYLSWTNPPDGLPRIVRDHKGVIRLLAQRILGLRDLAPPLPPAVANAYLTAILAEFVNLAKLEDDNLAARVALYIEEHMPEPFGLRQLAHYVGLEKHHFCRKYKALTGHSPMQHVKRRRVEHAMGLLTLRPKRSLKDIASRVGVRDAHQLRRLFRRSFGLSIRAMRRGKK